MMSVMLKNLKSVLSEEYNGEKIKIMQNQKRLDSIEHLIADDYAGEKIKIKQNQERLDKIEKLLASYRERFNGMERLLVQISQEGSGLGEEGGRLKKFNFLDKKTNSQSGEDAILAYIVSKLQIPLEDCDYLDLGANRPIEGSNTNFFYTRGARGVLVEANPELIPDLKKYRSGDIILNNCVDTEDGKQVEFVIMTDDGLSTPDMDAVAEIQKINPDIQVKSKVCVQTITINTIMEKYFSKAPVICSVDIEGKDFEILSSLDFSKYRPLLIVVEMIEYSNQIALHDKRRDVLELMLSSGYEEYAFTGINSIFIDRKALEERWGY